MVTRHEFLAMLHEHLEPRGYLEIGVFQGDSLKLVQPGTPAIGIDPMPILHGHFPGTTQVYRMTSDEFFGDPEIWIDQSNVKIDLAFIDGMHLYEYALRDFMNVEKYANPHTVVVFDDVLPRNQEEAAREQCPGDWTGDVWKVIGILQTLRVDLEVVSVNTQPTGTCVVYNLDSSSIRLQEMYNQIIGWNLDQFNEVPEDVLKRTKAVAPKEALEGILEYYRGLEDR
jgi:methyltransferase family protein